MKSRATKIKLSVLLLFLLLLLVILSFNQAYFFLWLTVSFLGWYIGAFVVLVFILWFTKPIVYNTFVLLSILVVSTLCGIIIFQSQVGSFLERWGERQFAQESADEALGIGVFTGKQETRLAQAIVQNNVPEIRKLIGEGLDIHAKGRRGEGFLEFALSQSVQQKNYSPNSELLKALLEAGIEPNRDNDASGPSNIIDYWQNFNPDDSVVLETLVKGGADIPERWYRYSPQDLRIFFRNGAKINETREKAYDQGEYGTTTHESSGTYVTGQWTPIMHAVDEELWDQAICLIALGVNIAYKDEHGVTLERVMAVQGISYADQPQFQELLRSIRQKQKIVK